MPATPGSALLLIPPVVLCGGAILEILFAKLLSPRGKGALAVLCALPAVASVLALIPAIAAGKSVHVQLGVWDGPLAIVLHADALSLLFALMGTLLGAIVLLYSIGYMAKDGAATRFYATMLVFIGGFVALVCSANLFLLYLWWEVIGLCSFSLVGFWYQQPDAVSGARKVLLMTHIAGYGLLAAIVVLYHRAGTAVWTEPAFSRNFSTGIFVLMLVALLAKSVQVPLHTWIPDAMAAPSPVSSLLHAACYVTAGVYLAARMRSFGVWPDAWNATLIAIATVTMVVGVVYALVQTDMKRMLAFSTVSQIGYMLFGIGIGTPMGVLGGLLHCLNHGFFKGGLFLNAGAVQHATGTRDMNQLGGLAGRMPQTTLFWMIGAGNMAGIPLMSGFVSKWLIYAAALQAGWAVPAVVAWMVSLGTVFICAKATSAVFLGPTTPQTQDAHEATMGMRVAMGCMAFGGVVLGIAPQLVILPIFQPMLGALGLESSLHVTWFGLFAGVGRFSTMGGLVLAIASVLVGGLVFALSRASRGTRVAVTAGGGGAVIVGGPGGGDIFTGGEPLWPHDRLTAQDFSRIFEQNWQGFFRWTNVDRVYAYIMHELLQTARLVAHAVSWLERHALVSLAVGCAGMVLGGTALLGAAPAFAEPGSLQPLPALLTAAVCIAGACLVCCAGETSEDRWLPLALTLPVVFCVAGSMVETERFRFGLLEVGSLLTILPVWRSARGAQIRSLYVTVVLAAACCMGLAMAPDMPSNVSRALLLTGVCVKFGAVPFLFWILRLADEVPALTLGAVLAIADVTAGGELVLRAQAQPTLFLPTGPWLAVAVLSSLCAGLLMLAQHSLKRLLVLSSVEDFGFVILGVASISSLGQRGVLLALTSHAAAKSLLFISLACAERDSALSVHAAGLAARYPYSAFGFLAGMIAMLGIPPMLGFAGRWKLYEVAFRVHPALLAGFVVASILALMAYVAAFTRVWWGPAHDLPEIPASADRWVPQHIRRESAVMRAAIVLLCAFLLVGGLWPEALQQAFRGGQP